MCVYNRCTLYHSVFLIILLLLLLSWLSSLLFCCFGWWWLFTLLLLWLIINVTILIWYFRVYFVRGLHLNWTFIWLTKGEILVIVILGKQVRNYTQHKDEVFPFLYEHGYWILNGLFFSFIFLISLHFTSFLHMFTLILNRHRHQPERAAFIISPVKCASQAFAWQFETDEKNRSLERDLVFPLKPLFRGSAAVTQETNHSQPRSHPPLPPPAAAPLHPSALTLGCSVMQRRRLRLSREGSGAADIECYDRAFVPVPFKLEAWTAKACGGQWDSELSRIQVEMQR